MKTIHRTALCLILSLVLSTPLFAMAPRLRVSPRTTARELLLEGELPAALISYQKLAEVTQDGSLAAEYAYVLALAGFREAALQQADRALQLDSADPATWYFASRVCRLSGMGELASALWPEGRQGVPDWIRRKTQEAESSTRPSIGSGDSYGTTQANRFARANALAAQGFRLSAAAAFERILSKDSGDALGHAGYSMVLEKLGAYGLAARESERARDLVARKSAPVLDRRAKALRAQAKSAPAPGVGKIKNAPSPRRGRWLGYAGGQFASADEVTTSGFNARFGKFLTDSFDVGADLGVQSTPGLNGADGTSTTTFGVSARLSKRLPGAKPLNLTLASRVVFAKDSTGFVFSPGMCQETRNGSMDLYLDFGSGPMKGVGVVMGYTMYLGVAR